MLPGSRQHHACTVRVISRSHSAFPSKSRSTSCQKRAIWVLEAVASLSIRRRPRRSGVRNGRTTAPWEARRVSMGAIVDERARGVIPQVVYRRRQLSANPNTGRTGEQNADELGLAADVDLRQDPLHVRSGGEQGNPEQLRELLRASAFEEEGRDRGFRRREAVKTSENVP